MRADLLVEVRRSLAELAIARGGTLPFAGGEVEIGRLRPDLPGDVIRTTVGGVHVPLPGSLAEATALREACEAEAHRWELAVAGARLRRGERAGGGR